MCNRNIGDIFSLVHTLYTPGSLPHYYLLCHSEAVAKKAMEIAERIKTGGLVADTGFLYRASLLHDTGIIFTNAPEIGCTGNDLYIMHGVLGAGFLEQHGLDACARVAERHILSGLTRADIAREKLPLPDHDMMPETLEEKIICFSDKFFSKVPAWLTTPKPPEYIMKELPEWCRGRFLDMVREFEEPGFDAFL